MIEMNTLLKKASFSFSSLAEEDTGLTRALPSSSSSEASAFCSHGNKINTHKHLNTVFFSRHKLDQLLEPCPVPRPERHGERAGTEVENKMSLRQTFTLTNS